MKKLDLARSEAAADAVAALILDLQASYLEARSLAEERGNAGNKVSAAYHAGRAGALHAAVATVERHADALGIRTPF